MRTTHRTARARVLRGLALGAITVTGLGCATITNTGFALSADFAPFHTWDWAEAEEPRVEVSGGSGALLDARLNRFILAALSERGYVRGREHPDFRVSYHLTLERRIEEVAVPRAPYLLSSHDSSPSYWIEGTDVEQRTIEHLRLAVDVADRSGRVAWRAAIRRRQEEGGKWDLQALVAEVLARFPKPRPVPIPPADTSEQLALLRS